MTPQPEPDDRSIADLTPEAVASTLSISAMAEQTGLSENVLRIWEARYGWPKPKRLANGYRAYGIELIPLLQAVQKELTHGQTIGSLLRDPTWGPILEAGRLPIEPARQDKRGPAWETIPLPDGDEARQLRAQLEQALERGDRGAVARIEAQAGRLRPQERERAISAVLRYWQELTYRRS